MWFKRTCNHLWNRSVTKREKQWMIPIYKHYHHTQKSTSGVNKKKMLAYRTAILLLISYSKYKIRPDLLALQSQEILNRPVFVLDILKSVWKLLKILNRFWKFWTLLKILNRFSIDSEHCWKFWTDSEHYWKFWTDSEHYLSSFKSIYFTSFSLDFN